VETSGSPYLKFVSSGDPTDRYSNDVRVLCVVEEHQCLVTARLQEGLYLEGVLLVAKPCLGENRDIVQDGRGRVRKVRVRCTLSTIKHKVICRMGVRVGYRIQHDEEDVDRRAC
jgi:hypothetical protein